ncbi:MAG: Alkane 1-monooxygenase [Bacteroidota bacterium]|jgi:alkane 1-monooxygenase
MRLRAYSYLLVYVTPAVVAYSLWTADHRSFSAVIILFGVIPFLELFTRGNERNLSPEEERSVGGDPVYDYLLYGLVPVQYLLLICFCEQIGREDLGLAAKVGMTTAFGMSCGVLGINAAHELGHRSSRYERWMSKCLLLTSLYLHFFIEHNRGHHLRVSTEEDPASSRWGESVYAFYIRSVFGGWLSAWRLEADRLRRQGSGLLTWRNEMVRFQVVQVAFCLAIWGMYGGAVLCWFAGAATIGFLLLESVNYIEHYGLRRRKVDGRYERTLPIHSWNSNHPLGRLMLLELSRHSDHHYQSSRKYPLLRHFEQSPQLPTGYPGMILLSLLPPLWFRVMHPRIERYRRAWTGDTVD